MASETQSMTGRGRKEKVTDEQILQLLRSGDPPVWSARKLAENTEVTRQTAHNRLDQLAERHEAVETMKIGNATVYYYDRAVSDPSAPIEERHKESIIREFTNKFVGLPTAPWTAVHPNDGPAEAGDKVQIRVEGVPGRWGSLMTHTWDSRREELIYEETTADETQALISGELYAKPTVPIEHENYPDDYDLELNIGGKYQDVEGRERPILIAAGVKNYLIKPCNDAVFLENVSVDWVSPKGHGQELETTELTEEMIEEVEEWRKENLEESDDNNHVEDEQTDREFVEGMLDSNTQVVSELWIKNLFAPGKLALDDELIELLATHPNSPLDSETEVRTLVEDVSSEPPTSGYEQGDDDDLDTDVI